MIIEFSSISIRLFKIAKGIKKKTFEMHVFYFFVMSEQRPDLSTFALIHFYPKIKTVIVERIILNNE